MNYQPGDMLFDKYRIECLLGRGAFAEVYLATHVRLNVERALKVLRKDAPGVGSSTYNHYRQRFEQEVQLGARLKHANLVPVYDLEQDGEALVLVMEYMAGGSLEGVVDKVRDGQALPMEKVLGWGVEIAEGLGGLHRRSLVHRDVKPANILLDEEGHVHMADLGLAQTPNSRLGMSLSEMEDHPGTLQYMPPEQMPGARLPLRPGADVYALGCVLFELLTGRVYYMQVDRCASALREDVPAWLDDLLERMLAEDAKARPQDGTDVAKLLRQGGKGQEQTGALPKVAEEAKRKAADEIEQKRKAGLLVELGDGVMMEFVRVPAGEFWMGSDPGMDRQASADEQPQHRVHLDEYLMGRYPVTVAQFLAFVRASGYLWNASHEQIAQQMDCPVVNVSCFEAVLFCEWLSKVSGRIIRLPTEAEWEKAARGSDRRMYPWGNEVAEGTRCNFGKFHGKPTPVGKFSPQGDSPYGCADMAGNVREWVADWHTPQYYSPSPGSNPTGSETKKYRGLRGGSWASGLKYLRAADRSGNVPEYSGYSVGFRCAADPVNSKSERQKMDTDEKIRLDETARLRIKTDAEVKRKTDEEAEARRRVELRLYLSEGVLMEFVRVPAGEFWMGSDAQVDTGVYPDELPRHKVYLNEYLIGKCPVTVVQFHAFLKAKGDYASASGNMDLIRKRYHPVANVNWQAAVNFCAWASTLGDRIIRLPSEAEWEKAARGADERIHPWGNEVADEKRCNYNNRFTGTTSVGRFSPLGDSPYGCVDMAGNVWEWTADWYNENYYQTSPTRNPLGALSGDGHTLRGGSWFSESRMLRAATRSKLDANSRLNRVGFRCVITV